MLAEAKGQREVAQEKAAALRYQIKQTTDAETEKQLALTEANKLKESAAIAEQTAEINLRKARLETQSIKTLADAEAYKKRELMKSNGQLEEKLKAYREVSEVWANAYSKRAVPKVVMGGSEGGSAGANNDVSMFKSVFDAMLAKDLALDIKMEGDTSR